MQEFDVGSVPEASQNPPHPHVPAASTSGPTAALGAIPKSGVSQELFLIPIYIKTIISRS